MITPCKNALVGVALAISLWSPCANAQNNATLEVFKGKYRGTMSLREPGGDVSNGTAITTFAVPANGRSAAVRYKATIPDGMGGSSAFPTALKLAPGKRITTTDLLVGIAGTNNAKPGKGRWSQRKRKLTFTATNGEGIVLRGTASTRDVGSRRLMKLQLTSTDPGGSYVFTNQLRARR